MSSSALTSRSNKNLLLLLACFLYSVTISEAAFLLNRINSNHYYDRRRRRCYNVLLVAGKSPDADADASDSSLNESCFTPSKTAKEYGKQEYWKSVYKDSERDFSWYAGWNDVEPFVIEFLNLEADDDNCLRVLVPGVGTDAGFLVEMSQTILEMTSSSTKKALSIDAFDYASESTEYCKRELERHSSSKSSSPLFSNGMCTINLSTADATDLNDCYQSNHYDIIIDKGTLDAVYLAGSNREERLSNLRKALSEFCRVLKPQVGIFWSLSAICTGALIEMIQSENNILSDQEEGTWQALADGSFYFTKDGYTSNNIDGTMIVWQKQ